jgi:TRAP-type C4-dicarboxylate transport system permease large subunit
VTPVRLEDIMVYVLPFYIPIVVVLMLIIFFPELVTFVPDQLMG